MPGSRLLRCTAWCFGGMFGGAIKKDKLFFFGSYQGQRVSDQLLGNSLVAVPAVSFIPGSLNLTSDRSAGTLANLVNADFGGTPCGGGTVACTATDMNPVAVNIMNEKAPDGSFFIPNTEPDPTTLNSLQNLFADARIQGPAARFRADQVITNLDYTFSRERSLGGQVLLSTGPQHQLVLQQFTAWLPHNSERGKSGCGS